MANKLITFALLVSLASNGFGEQTGDGVSEFKAATSGQGNSELFSGTRNLIDNLVLNMQQSATTAAQSVNNFTTDVQDQVTLFGILLANEVMKIREQVQDTIKNVTSNAEGLGAAITECIEDKRKTAEVIINDAVYNVSACAESRVSSIVYLVTELINVSKSAASTAQEAKQHASECVNGSINLFKIGACLGGVLWQTEVNSATIAGRSGLLIARINLSLMGLPATLQLCAASKLAQAALTPLQLMKDTAQCSLNAVTSAD